MIAAMYFLEHLSETILGGPRQFKIRACTSRFLTWHWWALHNVWQTLERGVAKWPLQCVMLLGSIEYQSESEPSVGRTTRSPWRPCAVLEVVQFCCLLYPDE
jgi:hypothetical protein